MIFEHIQIFIRKTTSESRRCCNVNTRLENRRRKHSVVATLFLCCRNDVGNTKLWQRCDNVVTTLSDVSTKIQPKPNVVTTSCTSLDTEKLRSSISFFLDATASPDQSSYRLVNLIWKKLLNACIHWSYDATKKSSNK